MLGFMTHSQQQLDKTHPPKQKIEPTWTTPVESGKEQGAAALAALWAPYGKRVLYVVTAFLGAGTNFLTVTPFYVGKNVLAVEVHQKSATSSDISLDMELKVSTTQAVQD